MARRTSASETDSPATREGGPKKELERCAHERYSGSEQGQFDDCARPVGHALEKDEGKASTGRSPGSD